MASSGLITLPSSFGQDETVTRLETALRANGLRVLARIDYAAAAADAGASLRPATLLTFGNPRDWVALLNLGQAIAIDLPLRALVWEDPARKSWLSYDDPQWLAERHGLGRGAASAVISARVMMETIARKATCVP